MSEGAMTYDSLFQDLLQYSEQSEQSDTDLAQQLPQIIYQAQLSLANRLKIQGYRNIVVGNLTPHSRVLPKPTGWRNTVTFVVRSNTPTSTTYPVRNLLRMRSFEYINMQFPDTTTRGLPSVYTDYDLNNWVLGDTPDQAYPFEITIYQLPPLLSEDVQTNYLTEFIPNALLYQCLLNLAPFMKDDGRIPTWKLMLDQELQSINTEELMKIVDRTQTRTSQ